MTQETAEKYGGMHSLWGGLSAAFHKEGAHIRGVGFGDGRGSDHEQFSGCWSVAGSDDPSAPALWSVLERR
jgi:hypothetical protein